MIHTFELTTICPSCGTTLGTVLDHEPTDEEVNEFIMGGYIRDHRPACIGQRETKP